MFFSSVLAFFGFNVFLFSNLASRHDPIKMNGVKSLSRLGAGFTIAFWLIIAIATTYTLFFASRPRSESGSTEELRTYRMVDAFALTDQHGQPLLRTDLDEKVWVASFIFTSCTAECLVLSHRMAELQNRFAQNPEVSFVSISVDPQTDTPERLAKYAHRYGAGPNWSFLTGNTREIDNLIKGSFLLPVARDDVERSKILVANLIHSERLAIVDRLGVVRFYADGMAPNAVETVSRVVERLLAEGP